MRYKAIVSYDGTNYAGWQIQSNGESIQEVIQKALTRITNQSVLIVGAGRTDSKVHANGQVFHFDIDKEFKDLAHSINSQLPNDIYIRSVQQVNDDFHARYDAIKKEYLYKINMGEYSPLLVNRVNQICIDLDIDKMVNASKVFIGKHDFTSFNATTLEEMPNQERTIENISFRLDKDILTISVIGDGFLRHMVRMIVGTLIEVGKGKIDKNDVKHMLDEKNKQACHYNAEACGLYLNEVYY